MRRHRLRALATPNFHRFHVRGTRPSTQDTHSSWHDRMKTKILNCIFGKWKKYLSVLVHLVALLLLSRMVVQETKQYNDKPTSTAVENDAYPVRNINFPAIGLCNLNLISKKKVSQYARQLWGQDRVRKIGNLTLERLEKLLTFLGQVYSFSSLEANPGDLNFTHHILNVAYNNEYFMWRVMDHLMPHCRDSLAYCSWKGEIRDCEELFVPRWTQDGSCCTFNYLRWTDTISTDGKSDFDWHMEKLKFATPSNGLRVYLNPHFEDNYYSYLPARGFKLFIFTATDYPDEPSGSMKGILLKPGTDNYLKLKGSAFYSSEDVRAFDPSKRGCLFSTDRFHEYGGGYSYSQCLMLCRSRDIVKACGCIPFFYPYTKEMNSVKDCQISEMKCLRNNRNKWFRVEPLPTDNVQAWIPREASTRCDCLPTCETLDFQVEMTGSDIRHSDIDLVEFVGDHHCDNVSKDSILLTISFNQPTILRLKQDVMYYWYDLLSNFGGLCSLFLGISILTPIEMIYEFSLRIWGKEKTPDKSRARGRAPTIVEPMKIQDPSLYWREMIRRKCDPVQSAPVSS
ncbi:sodium channel protein Nach-like [Venturia canescens]|uniref:sodium channel protein Nach-like n=1 Tax=Venturia canescens TaxID=32260 RepID=UPI001C9C8B26|nr:sodium channel protein Nach-like [Venturia canescens]